MDCLAQGKRILPINIKSPKGQELIRKLSSQSDVLIDPYRPGVLEKSNLGPDILMKDNPRLIYARLTGFGQTGPLSKRAGHDINYVAMSGILSMLGKSTEPPRAPINLIADFAGGGLLCAFGICVALLERNRSGQGQLIDQSMSEGAAYVGSWLIRSQKLPIWNQPRGKNMLDGDMFYYRTYETKDGKFMSVGALEPQFFNEFVRVLGLPDINQFEDETGEITKQIEQIFKSKTQSEWTKLYDGIDACVFPVLDWQTASNHPHNKSRYNFVDKRKSDGDVVPRPSPLLSRTPGISGVVKPETNWTTSLQNVFDELGLSNENVDELCKDGVLNLPGKSKL